MLNKVTYEYAIIRLVPVVEREEFVNIGVILFSKKKKYLDLKYQIDQKRIHSLYDEIDLDMIGQYLAAWRWICEGNQKGGFIGNLELSLRFRWLVATRSTIIQSSKTHSGLCESPEKVLEEIYRKYVL